MSKYGRDAIVAQLTSEVGRIDTSNKLPFKDALSSEQLANEFSAASLDYRERVFSPQTTLLAFMAQVLCPDRSCQQAVMRVNADRISHGLKPASSDTGAYCRARGRLPEGLIRGLVLATGQGLERAAPRDWLWKGRHVKLVDGSSVSMPDTSANQTEYPQQSAQKPGLGFPIARIVAVISLAIGCVMGLAIGPFAGKLTGEHALMRQLLNCFSKGDIALADAYYGSYFWIAAMLERGVDVVCRQHGSRQTDFRRGKRLGQGDHIVTYNRPTRPTWMSAEEYAKVPESINMREVSVTIDVSGTRSKSLAIITTLLCPFCNTKTELANIFRQRWHVELDLRSIQDTMQMKVLSCKTPSMVRKEVWTHLLAYNLIRKVMAEAASKHELTPRQVSFKAALQALNSFRFIWIYDRAAEAGVIYEAMLDQIAQVQVANRPNRIEPRQVKRRNGRYDLLTKPRATAREALLRRRTA